MRALFCLPQIKSNMVASTLPYKNQILLEIQSKLFMLFQKKFSFILGSIQILVIHLLDYDCLLLEKGSISMHLH